MDNLTQKIRTRFDHNQQRRVLREKYEAKMVFAYAGGMWRAGPELNNLIFTCGRMGEIVLPDLYNNPIKVDSQELIALSQERWNEQMNAWYVEYEELNKNR
jgi:hypothetical protein